MIMDIWPNGIQPESLSLNDILDCGMIQHAYYKNYTLNTQLVFVEYVFTRLHLTKWFKVAFNVVNKESMSIKHWENVLKVDFNIMIKMMSNTFT